MQVLREHEATAPAHIRVWTEHSSDSSAGPAERINPALLRLPIWTDAVLQSAQPMQPPSPAEPVVSRATVQLPQSVTWQRIPEPMVATSINLVFKGHTAAEVQQGLVCGLTLSIVNPSEETTGIQQQAPVRQLAIHPTTFVRVDEATLSAKVELPIKVGERVSLTANGEVCGTGDAVYLASWGEHLTSQSFSDDAMEAAYVLSHGDAAADDACLVRVLLHQVEDAGEPYMLISSKVSMLMCNFQMNIAFTFALVCPDTTSDVLCCNDLEFAECCMNVSHCLLVCTMHHVSLHVHCKN